MINEILKILYESNNFVSGEDIANTLGVSRAYIWKNIVKLKEMGYGIESSKNRGYYLNKRKNIKNIFNSYEIIKDLKTNILGKKCHFFNKIDSTNDYAKKIAETSKEGTIVVSNFQKNGRGRFENTWYSEENVGIYLSILLKPNIYLINSNQITLIAGIALCRILNKYKLNVKIKWPNDIILNGRKVAGILTEVNAEMEKIHYIVMGIGLNVNNTMFLDDLGEKATSLFLESGKNFDRKKIIQNFLYEFETMYNEYLENVDFRIFLNEYKNLCINLGQEVKLKFKNKDIFGKIIDISEYGTLVFLDKDNKKFEVSSGEVSIRNKDDKYI